MTTLTKLLVFLSFFSILIALSMAEIPKPVYQKPLHRKVDISYLRYLDKKIKDTLYTTRKSYIEIDLKTQQAAVIMKTGERFNFPVSTGTNTISQGVLTNEGVFAIFSKQDVAVSKDFNCNLYYWMQFNYGIGLHGLDGNGYYIFLGKQPSSHGCVRTSNEDIKIAYSLVEFGSPVLVKTGDNNAITVSFVEPNDPYIYTPSAKEISTLVQNRLSDLYSGNFDRLFSRKIVIDNLNLGMAGVTIGDISRIPDSKLLLYKTTFEDNTLTKDFMPKSPVFEPAEDRPTKDTAKSGSADTLKPKPDEKIQLKP